MDWVAVGVLSPVLVAAGVLIGWIGIKATKGTLERNWMAGIRTKATLESDEAWEAAHYAGGRLMTWAGASSVVAGLLLLVQPSNIAGLVILSVGVGLLLVLVVVSGIKGDRAAKAVLADGDGSD
jgi:uncharacterized membrane protein